MRVGYDPRGEKRNPQRTGGWRWVGKNRFMRVRIAGGRRESIPLTGVRTDEEADTRAAVIATAIDRLVQAGRHDKAKVIGDALGRATTPGEIEIAQLTVDRLVETGAVASKAITFAEFARKWTSGELHRLYPDRVPDIEHEQNIGRLEKYVNPIIGSMPMARFQLDDAELVMARLSADLAPASRRHVAQLLIRVARLATYPGKVLAVCPIPRGFLPKKVGEKAKPYLYPTEDAQLLACRKVPLARRLAYGILAREGMRASELLGAPARKRRTAVARAQLPLTWGDVDLDKGTITLDENKTDDPRSWAADPGVITALKAWRALQPSAKESDPIFPVDASQRYAKKSRTVDSIADVGHLARQLRADLEAADVKREKLFERSETRSRFVAHHLRATFVTISLANGKTETWVQDRTGHTTSGMIQRYRRAARQAAEIGLGPLKPLHIAIPELAPAKKKKARGA